jgi:Brp/Blh family beta-carotene 15,15'-monooxygenase
MLLNHLQQEVYKKYQLILLMNLSIISLLLMIIEPTILNINTQLILLLTTVTIIGIPHGYFDFLIAKKLFNKHENWLVKFIFVYTSLSLVYLLVWFISPALALIIFLIMSIYHFGVEESEDIKDNNILLVLYLGSVPIVVPILFHTAEVYYFFDILLNQTISYQNDFDFIKYVYCVGLIGLLFLKVKKLLPLYGLLLINFIFLPPLLSFILYFCFHHSIRHYLHAMGDSNIFSSQVNVTKFATIFLALTVVFTMTVLGYMSEFSNLTYEKIIVKYIFITLACLTLPHLLLNIVYENKLNYK